MRKTNLVVLLVLVPAIAQESPPRAQRDDGYRGIWYANQKTDDEYGYKYSGGLATYCAKHQPFAVYCAAARKTFFCYGGTTRDSQHALQHMVSYFDHASGQVPRPAILLDKQTSDAHDNPVIAVDDDGRLWVFSTSHGRSRPSFVHRSVQPHSIAAFERVDATYETEAGERAPLDNFSYMQAWHVPGRGFACFFTRYADPAARTNVFMTSADGVRWSRWQRLAAIQAGHYQISAVTDARAACAFNYHPAKLGLNWRTNLYYLETEDFGATWHSADGGSVTVPLTQVASPTLVHDYAAAGLNVYLKDLRFDPDGRPVILYVTSRGYEAGPRNDPRTWTVARWTAEEWVITAVTTSDNNYDTGSLIVETATRWQIIAPTDPGPQRYNPGGEMVRWTTVDAGRTWTKTAQLTANSPRNHTYARHPVSAHPDFYALWADGDGRRPSPSRLYFCNRAGDVFELPAQMQGEFATPVRVPRAR